MINERYRVIKLLGEGRSRVFLCEDTLHGSINVVMKVLDVGSPDYEVKNFREEYIKLRKFNNKHIVKGFEYGTVVTTGNKEIIEEIEKGSKFFTLEFINGRNLREFYNTHSEKKLREITKQICETLFYIHESNYIYFDLKPENLLVGNSEKHFYIKLIDFGFAEQVLKKSEEWKKGTAQYIAPELLLGKEYDKRVDFYSLGVLLYFLMFGKFPFGSGEEIEIYRRKISEEITFGKHNYSVEFENIVRKLLRKNPAERYSNAFEILSALKIKNKQSFLTEWKPVKSFQITDTTLEITDFIFRNDTNQILNLIGRNNAGKTALAEEIYQNFPDVFWVTKNDIPSDKSAWEIILRKIVYSAGIFGKLPENIKNDALNLLAGNSENIQQQITHIFNYLTSELPFVLFLDDFDLYDLFTRNLIENSFTLFVVNKAKLIILTKTEINYSSTNEKIIKKIFLKPFNEYETGQFIVKTFSSLFPLKKFSKLATELTDLYPGNIYDMLEGLFLGKLLLYEKGKIKLSRNDFEIKKLDTAARKNLFSKLQTFSAKKKRLLDIISVFPNGIEHEILFGIWDGGNNLQSIIDELVQNGFLKFYDNKIRFTSKFLRESVYSQIENKHMLHLLVAENLEKSVPNYPRVDLARQYELGGNKEKVFELIYQELESIRPNNLFVYEKYLLEYLLRISPEARQKINVKVELSKTLYQLGEFEKSLTLIDEIIDNINGIERKKLNILKADCYVAIGKIKKAVKIYSDILEENPSREIYEEVLIKLATAESYMDLFYQSKAKCIELINRPEVSELIKAQAYNLMGILEHNLGSEIKLVEDYFRRAHEIYTKLKMPQKLAKTSINLGIINNIKENYTEAQKWWDEALRLAQKTGSLEEEITIRTNYVIFYIHRQQFDKAEKYSLRTLRLAEGLNKKYEAALIYLNLSEVEIIICEYEKALEHLLKSKDIFEYLGSYTELSEVYFLLAYLHYLIEYREEFVRYSKVFLKTIKSSRSANSDFLEKLINLFAKTLNNEQISSEHLLEIFNSCGIKEDKIFEYYYYLYALNQLYVSGNFDLLNSIFETDDFKKLESENILISAQKNYLYGKIFQKNNDKINSLLNFEEAFEKLNNVEITELTWKTSIELAEIYFERGNINKASEYLEITENILQIISSKFKHFELKNAYFQNKERAETLQKIERWQILIH